MNRYALEAVAKYLVAIAIMVFVILRMVEWASNELMKVGANL